MPKNKKTPLKFIGPAKLPTSFGLFKIYTFKNGNSENIILVKGKIANAQNVLVRIHSQCLTGDIFKSLKCDCGWQLQESLKKISKAKKGILIYLDQEGRGLGLINKIMAYQLQDKGLDTCQANEKLGLPIDARDFGIVKKVLNFFKVKSIKLLTNNPNKINALLKKGIIIKEIIPLTSPVNNHNHHYLKTKKERLSHFLLL